MLTVLTPTPEQDDVVGLFLTGHPVTVTAGAGTGKTSTLEMVARATPRRGTYLAFNRRIVQQVGQRFPMSVSARTMHSLALGAVGDGFRGRLGGDRVPSWQLAKLLSIDPVIVRTIEGREKYLSPSFLASLTMRTLRTWCYTEDPTPSAAHMLDQRALDLRSNVELRKYLDPYVEAAWTDVCAGDLGRLPVEHDHYLKAWTLDRPDIAGDFVLVDEAQDLNPCMVGAIRYNADVAGRQVVLVGDPAQQIYSWRGSVDAMAVFDEYLPTTLSKSWRFGPEVAAVANCLLVELGSTLRLVGNDTRPSTVGAVTDPRAVLCRTNVGAMSWFLDYLKAGRHPHLVGDGKDVLSFAKGVADLQERGSSGHPDLACFDSWAEVRAYVEQDPAGDELVLMVKMIDEYGLAIIIDALDGMIAEDSADVVVSTVHKAKGREWPTVKLGGDFPDIGPDTDDEERRLLYVAATRAIDALDPRSCEPLVDRLTHLG